MVEKLTSLTQVQEYKVNPTKRLFSADRKEICEGWTTDIYFIRTQELLRHLELEKTIVTAEIFANGDGVFCGSEEVGNLLGSNTNVEMWSLSEGEKFQAKEVVMRIHGVYSDFGLYETAILGILASSCGWATAARYCREAAKDKKVICFGARHVHPAVAPVMERAAVVGGADGCSCILAAKLLQREPSGTVPHAVFLVAGDTIEIAKAYDDIMPDDAPRIILVDTFKDEAEESLRVAEALQDRLDGVRLDTPGERGGVTPGLVREVRARLDQSGFQHVQILVSGGITPERIVSLAAAGVSSFGVGSFISRAAAIDMTMDIKEVQGRAVAKRGRIPGITYNSRLRKQL